MTHPQPLDLPALNVEEWRSRFGCAVLLHRGSDGTWLVATRCEHEGDWSTELPNDQSAELCRDMLVRLGFTRTP